MSIGDTEPPDWIGGDGLSALSPQGNLVASFVNGSVQVRRTSDAGASTNVPRPTSS